MVVRLSTEAGKLYGSFGKPGATVESMKEALEGMLDPVWYHDLGAGVQAAILWLEETAAFSVLKTSG